MEATALWHITPETSALRTAPLDPADDATCLVQAQYSLISTGTERRVARGTIPHTLHPEMTVPYMAGGFDFPIKYGYSWVGEIVDGPAAWHGKRVHVLHPHQDRAWIHLADVFEIPASIPSRRATLASNLETVLNAIWDAHVQLGDRVLIVGFGLIGSLLARVIAHIPATTVLLTEPDPARAALAQTMGFTVLAPEDLPHDFDVAFNTSTTGAGLQCALDHVGFEGTVVELSWHGTETVELNLGADFHTHRKRLISSQVSTLPAQHRNRWDHRRRKAAVFHLLENPAFDDHLTHAVAFTETPAFFAQLRHGTVDGLGWVIAY